ncbi:calcium-activated potassium channel subunit beta-1 isoform X2 [Pseudophryne corroboree]|uniref:calcium-activated potassium channel subunit beta-1 isoform X2 n=1 Tax=Pseudophryne corroboree TaxID=495146 RepID=UPI0030813DD7
MGKKLFMAQKRGETRAVCLGIGMIICSVMIFFLLGVTVLPKYLKSVWTEKSKCTLVQATFKEKASCTHSINTKNEVILKYPCLEVLVNLNYSEDIFMLYHTEESLEWNYKWPCLQRFLGDLGPLELLTGERTELERISTQVERMLAVTGATL